MLNARSGRANRTTAGRWTAAAALLASTVTVLAACGGGASGSSAPESSANESSDTVSSAPVIRGNAVVDTACTTTAQSVCAVAGANVGEMVLTWSTRPPVGFLVTVASLTNGTWSTWGNLSNGCKTGTNTQRNVTTCTETGLAAGTYKFTVKIIRPTMTTALSESNLLTLYGFNAPNAPVIGAATATGSTTATVAFTAPSDGGSPITTYTATSSPAGGSGTLSQAGSGTITVTGLTAGTTYTFTVKASNSGLTSVASGASGSVKTFTSPDAPVIGAATATGSTSATVAFTAPSNGGTPITSYTATSSPGGKTGTVSGASAGTVTVTGLTGGTAYTFTVTATNTVGTSGASAPSAPVTTTYSVGNIGPGGGKVFYVATTPFACGPTLTSNCTYLEAAPQNSDPAKWCSEVNTQSRFALIPGVFRSDIGTGYSNTMLMVNGGCTSGQAVTARASTTGGMTDWYLPSEDELTVLYTTLLSTTNVSDYWSSTQVTDKDAVRRNGSQKYAYWKVAEIYARFIRAF